MNKLDKPYYIYRHIRPDTNQVFYIGKGKNYRNSYSYLRSRATANRNPHWKQIVNKCNGEYDVQIVMEFETPEQCIAKEIELIALYGRDDLKRGVLCNMTDGGDGPWGRVGSDKQRSAASKCMTGNKYLLGKIFPQSWRQGIAAAKIGERNPMYGKTGKQHHNSRTIIDTTTGEIYYGVIAAAKVAGIKPGILYQYLDGSRKNKTTLVLAGGLRND